MRPEWLRCYAEPFAFFLAIALSRACLETSIFSTPPYLGYYPVLHHVLWFCMIALTTLLLAHYILKKPLAQLTWILYGSVVLFLPLMHCAIVGMPMQAGYLDGSPVEILIHTLTFCLSYAPNIPLSLELLLIFGAMLWLGKHYSGAWRKGWQLAIAVHVIGCILAINWIGTAPHASSLFRVNTRLANHPLWAVVLMVVVSVLVLAFAWRVRSGQAHGDGEWDIPSVFREYRASLAAGTTAWCVAAIALQMTGREARLFDALAIGISAMTCVIGFVHGSHCKRHGHSARFLLPAGLIVLVVQTMVLLPIALKRDRDLSPFTQPAQHRQTR